MTTDTGERLLTTGAAAKLLGIELWQLLRLLHLGRLPEPGRVGSLRAWSDSDVERVREALAAMGVSTGREGSSR
ncbi:MAG: hypothetical protein U0797_30310 [Gemmataceae bacterium]